MEDKIKDVQDTQENLEQDNADYENNKAKLSKYMTVIIVLMVIIFGVMVFLNKYYNG